MEVLCWTLLYLLQENLFAVLATMTMIFTEIAEKITPFCFPPKNGVPNGLQVSTPTSPRSVRLRSLHRMCRSMSSGPGLGLAPNSTRHLVAARSEGNGGVRWVYPLTLLGTNPSPDIQNTFESMIFPTSHGGILICSLECFNQKTAVDLVVHPRLEVNGVLLGSLKQTGISLLSQEWLQQVRSFNTKHASLS